jgi:hypothetical protein
LPRPIFDLSSSWGLKTIAHRANLRQMAKSRNEKSLLGGGGGTIHAVLSAVHQVGTIVAIEPARRQ